MLKLASILPVLACFVSACQFLALFTLSAPRVMAQQTFEEYLDIGGGSFKRGRLEEAEQLFLQALALTKEMDPFDVRRAAGMEKLGAVYHSRGEYVRAQTLLEQALVIRRKDERADPADLASCMNNLAVVHDELGDLDKAVDLYESSLKAWQEAVGPLHPDLAVTRQNLAALYRTQARYGDAERLYQELLETQETMRRTGDLLTAEILVSLGDVRSARWECGSAIPFYERAASIETTQLGPDHPKVADTLSRLAACHLFQDSPAKAEPLYRKSIETLTRSLGSDHIELVRPLNDLATVLMTAGRHVEAQKLYERALALCEKSLERDDPRIVTVLTNLFLVHSYQGQEQTAQQVYARLVSIVEGSLGGNHPEVVSMRETLNRLRSGILSSPQARVQD